MEKKAAAYIRTLMIAMFVFVFAGAEAQAFFVAETPENKKGVEKINELNQGSNTPSFGLIAGSDYVTQLGSGDTPKTVSRGRDLPLDTALKIITPDKWTFVDKSKEEDLADRKVTWENEGPWTNALQSIGRGHRCRFVVDWGNRIVFGGDLGSGMMEGIRKDQADDAKSDIKMKKVAAEPAQRWELKPGKLKAQIKKWCEKKGCQLAWKIKEDWYISTETVFKTSFIEAVKQVVKAVRERGTWIEPDYYPDNDPPILVIK